MASDAETPTGVPSESLAVLADVEAALTKLGKAFDGPGLSTLRTLVAGCPDLGARGAGEVAASLFMLLERLIDGGRCDREALAVHVRAWRLMATRETDDESRAALLAGLRRVRDLYAEARAA